MIVKKVTRNISESKQFEGSFTVPFGNREEFDLLLIELVYLGSSKRVCYQIESQYLPYNKGNATRFRIVQSQVRWCSKVAAYMNEGD